MNFRELDKDAFTRLVEAGRNDVELAAQYTVSSRTILRWRTSLGLVSRWEPERSPCGTYSSYSRGCRCAECRAANRDYCARTIKNMQARGLSADDPRHGTNNGYQSWGCRCEACKVAHAESSRDFLNTVRAAAWDEGAKWAAVECGAIDNEDTLWVAPGDNPYRKVSS